MGLKNTDTSYGHVAKAFHWIMFLMLAGMVIVGIYMHELPSETPEQASYKFGIYDMHKSFGLLVLILVALRLGWRMINPVPKMPDSMSRIESLSAHSMHILLYVLMFAQPITGWLMSSYGGHAVKFFGLQVPAVVGKDKPMSDIMHEAHEVIALLLIISFVIHVAASLFHHFVRKDDVLVRMSLHPGKSDRSS